MAMPSGSETTSRDLGPGRSLYALAVSRGARPLPVYVRGGPSESILVVARGHYERLAAPALVMVRWNPGTSLDPSDWEQRHLALADDGHWLDDVQVLRRNVRTRGVQEQWFATVRRSLRDDPTFNTWAEAAAAVAAILDQHEIVAGPAGLRSGVMRDGSVHYRSLVELMESA